eukprot:1153354-Pelagomonas_calceolata.AAC.2
MPQVCLAACTIPLGNPTGRTPTIHVDGGTVFRGGKAQQRVTPDSPVHAPASCARHGSTVECVEGWGGASALLYQMHEMVNYHQ